MADLLGFGQVQAQQVAPVVSHRLILTAIAMNVCSSSRRLRLERLEEAEEGVWRAIPARRAVWRCRSSERSLLESEVGVQIHLCGLDALMPEPERDDCGVDAGVQESHRGGVAQPVHGDAFVAERWAGVGGDGDVSGQPALEPVAGQRTAVTGGERLGSRIR